MDGMKGIKYILCGIAVILVGLAFTVSSDYTLSGLGETILFVTGLGLAFYGLKKNKCSNGFKGVIF